MRWRKFERLLHCLTAVLIENHYLTWSKEETPKIKFLFFLGLGEGSSHIFLESFGGSGGWGLYKSQVCILFSRDKIFLSQGVEIWCNFQRFALTVLKFWRFQKAWKDENYYIRHAHFRARFARQEFLEVSDNKSPKCQRTFNL